MLPSIFTDFPGISSALTVSPMDDVERIQIMIANIEKQQMVVRANMLSLISHRQKVLSKKMEQLTDDYDDDDDDRTKDADKTSWGQDMLFKASIPASIPRDLESGKDDLAKGSKVARYQDYETKIEDLSDIETSPRMLELSSRPNRVIDTDGDVEMGGIDQTHPPPNHDLPTRQKLSEEIMGLVDQGLQELDEFDKVAKQDIDKLQVLLEKARSSKLPT